MPYWFERVPKVQTPSAVVSDPLFPGSNMLPSADTPGVVVGAVIGVELLLGATVVGSLVTGVGLLLGIVPVDGSLMTGLGLLVGAVVAVGSLVVVTTGAAVGVQPFAPKLYQPPYESVSYKWPPPATSSFKA